MAHFTISNKVDHNIFAEFLAVLGGNSESVCNVVHRVCVDMEDGAADRRGDLRAVDAGPCSVWSSSKADLVIDDDMDGSADCVVLERLHLEALVNDSLTGNGCISMHDNRDDLLAIFLLTAEEMLFSTGAALHARIDGFQVRRVRHQGHLDFVASIAIASAEGRSKMVLDIASLRVNSLSSLLWLNALELGHDDLHGLPDYVGEGIESASMCHSNDEGSGALLNCGVDAEFEAWDESFAALEAKSFHSIKFASHECAPLMRPVQTLVHMNLFTF